MPTLGAEGTITAMEALGAAIEIETADLLYGLFGDLLDDIRPSLLSFQRGDLTLGELRRKILGWSPDRAGALSRAGFGRVAEAADSYANSVGLRSGLPVDDPDIAAAQRDVSVRVNELVDQAKRNLLATLDDAIDAGMSNLRTVREATHTVGLTEPYRKAVANYRAAMARQGIAQSVMDQRAADYARQLLQARVNTWSRTHAGRILGGGQLAVGRHLAFIGVLPFTAQKVWITARDERTCPVCREMEGRSVPWDTPWTTPSGLMVMVPSEAHPNCRCFMDIELEPPESTIVKAQVARAALAKAAPLDEDPEPPSWCAPHALQLGISAGALWAVVKRHDPPPKRGNPWRDADGLFTTKAKAVYKMTSKGLVPC